jgi:hypothetical protein
LVWTGDFYNFRVKRKLMESLGNHKYCLVKPAHTEFQPTEGNFIITGNYKQVEIHLAAVLISFEIS